MDAFRSIAEEKIKEAIERGEFDRLPGFGKPLPPDDAEGVPEELRLAFKVLKNAGLLPEEMQLRKEMLTLEDLLRCAKDEGERKRLQTELTLRRLRYRTLMEQRGWKDLSVFSAYEAKLEERLAGNEGDGRRPDGP
ncbi:MAG TPA: DUF1992 domain-containing protein [Paenibacillaceae bacterium]